MDFRRQTDGESDAGQSRQGRDWNEYGPLKRRAIGYRIFAENEKGDVLNPKQGREGSEVMARDIMKPTRREDNCERPNRPCT
jgi:hypothetical protein